MVNTETTSYAIIDVYRDRLEVRGFGRESDRKLMIPASRESAKIPNKAAPIDPLSDQDQNLNDHAKP